MCKRYDVSKEQRTKLLRRTAIIDSYNRKYGAAAQRGMSKAQFRKRLMADLERRGTVEF